MMCHCIRGSSVGWHITYTEHRACYVRSFFGGAMQPIAVQPVNCNWPFSLSHSKRMEEQDPITQLRSICEEIRHDSELAVENDFAIGKLAVQAAEFAMERGFPLHKAASLCVTPLLIHRNMVGVRLCYANFLRENGLEVEAAKEFREATLAAPTPLHGLALEAHRSSMSQIAPRWHFRMMNDRSRNAAYRLAIQRATQAMPPGRHTVLDIGAGAGLLGAYCMDAAQ